MIEDSNKCKYDLKELKDIRNKLSKIALSYREGCNTSIDPDVPRIVENDFYFVAGKLQRRKRVILRSNGCSIATCTMCPFTNETKYGCEKSVTIDNYLNQLSWVFSKDSLDNYDVLSIYIDGSFFSESEMPRAIRSHIYTMVKNSECSMLVVESSPQFIKPPQLEEAKTSLAGC